MSALELAKAGYCFRLRNAVGLAEAGIAMMDNQIIIGEGRKREREGHEVGRHLPVDSIDPEQPRRP